MTPQDVIDLFNEPEKLMRRCHLAIAGGVGHTGANGQATVATFQIDVAAGQTVRGFTTGVSGLFGRQKDRPVVRIRKLAHAADPAPAGHINAYYIPMVQVNDVLGGNSHYTLPTAGAIRLAITSQITGCVFSVGSAANGAVLASHVQPPGGDQAQANAAGRAGFGADIRQVRREVNYEAGDRVAVIGTLTNGHWSFFMQRNAQTNGVYDVRSATKIIDI